MFFASPCARDAPVITSSYAFCSRLKRLKKPKYLRAADLTANTCEAPVCIKKYSRAPSLKRIAAYLRNTMNESKSESKVYEIGYLLVPSIPAEKVGEQASAFYSILEKNSAVILADESPSLISLAYEMDKSTGGGSHQRFDEGYFGWVKFSCSPSVVEEIRKAIDQNPNILRTLAISTVSEKTYLGKRAKSENRAEDRSAIAAPDAANAPHEAASAVKAPLSAAEITAVDKQLDEIVKGA